MKELLYWYVIFFFAAPALLQYEGTCTFVLLYFGIDEPLHSQTLPAHPTYDLSRTKCPSQMKPSKRSVPDEALEPPKASDN